MQMLLLACMVALLNYFFFYEGAVCCDPFSCSTTERMLHLIHFAGAQVQTLQVQHCGSKHIIPVQPGHLWGVQKTLLWAPWWPNCRLAPALSQMETENPPQLPTLLLLQHQIFPSLILVVINTQRNAKLEERLTFWHSIWAYSTVSLLPSGQRFGYASWCRISTEEGKEIMRSHHDISSGQ